MGAYLRRGLTCNNDFVGGGLFEWGGGLTRRFKVCDNYDSTSWPECFLRLQELKTIEYEGDKHRH